MYVAARGGEDAIQHAETLYRALNGPLSPEFIRRIERTLPYLVDRVMAEGSLYAPELAALAIAQTGGDLYEAVLLLRAYRSTVPRLAYAEQVAEDDLLVVRRISAAFKDIPGGQVLGPTLDYSHRILRTEALTTDFTPDAPTEAEQIHEFDLKLGHAAERGMDALQEAWRAVPPKFQASLKAALDRRHKPTAMQAMQRSLQTLVSCCQGNDRPDCPILDDLASGQAEPHAPRALRKTLPI